jgi:hypothetical protein
MEKMYCPACKEEHTFTILGKKLGCWNENCPKRVFGSKDEFDNYDKKEDKKDV